ncbi:hypothetical protein [Streptomyces sp. NPDC056061]|uniref:hypothetical protein n=1 Tax=Streptomyces sp. NPDC056061 TaxID=3345700 RepID=UPI0035E17FFE
MNGQTTAVTPLRQPEKRPGFVRRNAWILTLAAFLALVATLAAITWSGQHTATKAQESRIGQLEGRLKTAQLKNSERVEQDTLEALGISQRRLDADSRIVTRLAETAFTWDSGAAYERARAQLKDRYALTEDDAFLREFMPPSRYNEDDTGKRYYYIDTAGLNSAVGDAPDIEVVKVAAGDYAYAFLVDVAVTSDSVERNSASPEKVTAHRRMLLFVTVDAEGGVSGLSGIPASGSTRLSG